MKGRFITVFSLVLLFLTVMASELKRIPLEGHPWKLTVVGRNGERRIVALDRISSQIITVDVETMETKTVKIPPYPTDLLVKGTRVYVTCMESGKLILFDPFSAKVLKEVTIGRHVFRFMVLDSGNFLWVLDVEGAVLELDADLEVMKIYNLPHFSLDAAMWNGYLVSLNSQNYETIWGRFSEDGEKGVYLQNLGTGETEAFYAGKIPTWIHATEDRLYVLSYWDGLITEISKDHRIVGRLELKGKVNGPVWTDNRCYLLSFDDSTLIAVDLNPLRIVRRTKLRGKGPIQMKLIQGRFYVLNVLDNSMDVIDAKTFEVVDHIELGRYPADVVGVDDSMVVVACEESEEIWLWYNHPTNPR